MSNQKQKIIKIALIALIIIAVIIFNQFNNVDQNVTDQNRYTTHNQTDSTQNTYVEEQSNSSHKSPNSLSNHDDSEQIKQAFTQQLNDVQVKASGKVKKVLSDDNDGSRHQRFILELSTGQTILIAHNIDLAPRVENLQSGDRVEFYGVYEYNPQGGVVHWTHHDPQNKHIGGWLKHNNKVYE